MKKPIIAALAFTLFAAPVFAQDTEGHGGPGGEHQRHGPEHFLNEVDTNKDGKVSKAEFNAKGETMFSESDADHDGFISQDEMKAAHEARMAKWKAMRDAHKAEEGKVEGKTE
jgi:Ca2+-binding EF-hand superfamily protein